MKKGGSLRSCTFVSADGHPCFSDLGEGWKGNPVTERVYARDSGTVPAAVSFEVDGPKVHYPRTGGKAAIDKG